MAQQFLFSLWLLVMLIRGRLIYSKLLRAGQALWAAGGGRGVLAAGYDQVWEEEEGEGGGGNNLGGGGTDSLGLGTDCGIYRHPILGF